MSLVIFISKRFFCFALILQLFNTSTSSIEMSECKIHEEGSRAVDRYFLGGSINESLFPPQGWVGRSRIVFCEHGPPCCSRTILNPLELLMRDINDPIWGQTFYFKGEKKWIQIYAESPIEWRWYFGTADVITSTSPLDNKAALKATYRQRLFRLFYTEYIRFHGENCILAMTVVPHVDSHCVREYYVTDLSGRA